MCTSNFFFQMHVAIVHDSCDCLVNTNIPLTWHILIFIFDMCFKVFIATYLQSSTLGLSLLSLFLFEFFLLKEDVAGRLYLLSTVCSFYVFWLDLKIIQGIWIPWMCILKKEVWIRERSWLSSMKATILQILCTL